MGTSLSTLVENLDPEKFYNLKKEFPDEEHFKLLRKGVFPYDWFDSLQKLYETQLPPKDAFYSKQNKKHISDEDYKHAQRVWNVFGCKTMKNYHDLCVESRCYSTC